MAETLLKKYVSSFKNTQCCNFWWLLDNSQCLDKMRQTRLKMNGWCDKSLKLDSTPDCYGNIETTLANWTTRMPFQKPWCIKRNLISATLPGLISLHSVFERKWMMSVFCSVVRAKIMSQRTGGYIKRPFVSSQWNSWLECDIKAKLTQTNENQFFGHSHSPSQCFEVQRGHGRTHLRNVPSYR